MRPSKNQNRARFHKKFKNSESLSGLIVFGLSLMVSRTQIIDKKFSPNCFKNFRFDFASSASFAGDKGLNHSLDFKTNRKRKFFRF